MPSKLGPHCLTYSEAGRQFMLNGSRIIKMVGCFGEFVETMTGRMDNATIIGRWYTPLTAEAQRAKYPNDAAAAAREFIDAQRQFYQMNSWVKLWEGHNEPVWGSAEDMKWYSDFEIARLKLLADMGLRGVIGCFATGNPGDIELWKWYLPAVAEAKQRNGVLGLHEYSSPWMWWMTGKYQMNPAEDQGDEGWTTLRYRKVMHKYLKPAGLDDVLIAITECGLDRIAPVPNGASSGHWRTNAEWWSKWDGSTDPIDYWRGTERNHERYFAEQLIWYDREMRKDPNVLGATLFTVGHVDPTWEGYELSNTRVWNYLVEYIKNEANVADPVMPSRGAGTASAARPISITSAGGLLKNTDFSGGVSTYKDQSSVQTPDGWTFWCADESTPRKGPEAFKYPRANIITPDTASPDDQDGLVGLPRAYRVVGNWRAIWFSLSQNISGLTSGKTYRFTARVMPDPVDRYEGANNDKVFVSDPDGGELWLKAVSGGQQTLTFKRVNADFQPGAYLDFTHDFTASGDTATVTFEVRARYALTQNAWYIASLNVAEAGGATATPASAPVVAPAKPATGGGKRGITGTLRLFVPDKLTYASQIENIKFYEEIQNQTSERKTYGVLGVEVLNKDTGEKKFHTSFSGDLVLAPNCKGPKDTCGGEVLDQMIIENSGNYRLSLQICHANLNDCMSGKGDWEQLSPYIDIVVNNWRPGQELRGDAAPGNFNSRGIVGNEFWIEKTEVRPNEDIWFNFKVTNTTEGEVPFSILAARSDTGFSAGSWTNYKIGPHQVLEWKDHINISQTGLHNIFLGIWYDGVDNGMRKEAQWDKLSNSVAVVVK